MDLKHYNRDRDSGVSPTRRLARRCNRRYLALPGYVRTLIWVVVFAAVFGGVTRHVHDERDFALKQYPSDFSPLTNAHLEAIWRPQQPLRFQNGTHIDDRYIFMRKLAKGNEGAAALYVDTVDGDVVVVKTYENVTRDGKVILRNLVPSFLESDFEDYGPHWPTEIEASLVFGTRKGVNGTAFVPVRDYFVLQTESADWHWALVTPFIEDGTLETLADATKVHERTPQKLDITFRPVFNDVLQNLGLLHSSGYCHDDIKPDNIFVADTKHWLIGDLGCVRHFAHPWHGTGRIKREKQWADCVLNDIRRFVKGIYDVLETGE